MVFFNNITIIFNNSKTINTRVYDKILIFFQCNYSNEI